MREAGQGFIQKEGTAVNEQISRFPDQRVQSNFFAAGRRGGAREEGRARAEAAVRVDVVWGRGMTKRIKWILFPASRRYL